MRPVSDAVDSIVETWESQLRKGVLEFIVLLCLRNQEHYGYALIQEVKERTSMEITEGTIYPLLDRLKSHDLVTAQWEEPEEGGVPRKYYHLTARGGTVLEEMEKTWAQLHDSVDPLTTSSPTAS